MIAQVTGIYEGIILTKTMIYNKAQEKIIKMNLKKQKKNRKKMMKTQKLLNKIMEY